MRTSLSEFETLEQNFLAKLARLSNLWGENMEEAQSLPVPTQASIDRFEQDYTVLTARVERDIPIRADEQREFVKRAHLIAGKGSLIPSHLLYVQQLRLFEKLTDAAGLSKLHGLRHRYAQERYQELTGWPAPACGGPTHKYLEENERLNDRVARFAISQELGHVREQITGVYLGR
ncbi:MAG: hypothetical protein ACI965_000687 [Paraglaciecola sp.]